MIPPPLISYPPPYTTLTPDPKNKVQGQDSLYGGQQHDTEELERRGWKKERVDKPNDSERFKEFLRGQGKSEQEIAEWRYYIETWTKGRLQ